MNDTEQRALSWLVKYTGLARDNFRFQFRDTPDFIDSLGRGWEIKHTTNGLLVFFSDQIERLVAFQGDCHVLVFRGDNEYPESSLPAGALRETAKLHGYRVTIHPTSATKPSEQSVIRIARLRLGLSISQMAERLYVSEMTIRRWESGQVKPSRLAELRLNGIRREAETMAKEKEG